MLTLTPNEWKYIRNKLKEDYAWKPSVFMIRETMRRELGFTPRFHSEYTDQSGYIEVVCLDFYSDEAETFFRMKYL